MPRFSLRRWTCTTTMTQTQTATVAPATAVSPRHFCTTFVLYFCILPSIQGRTDLCNLSHHDSHSRCYLHPLSWDIHLYHVQFCLFSPSFQIALSLSLICCFAAMAVGAKAFGLQHSPHHSNPSAELPA